MLQDCHADVWDEDVLEVDGGLPETAAVFIVVDWKCSKTPRVVRSVSERGGDVNDVDKVLDVLTLTFGYLAKPAQPSQRIGPHNVHLSCVDWFTEAARGDLNVDEPPGFLWFMSVSLLFGGLGYGQPPCLLQHQAFAQGRETYR